MAVLMIIILSQYIIHNTACIVCIMSDYFECTDLTITLCICVYILTFTLHKMHTIRLVL